MPTIARPSLLACSLLSPILIVILGCGEKPTPAPEQAAAKQPENPAVASTEPTAPVVAPVPTPAVAPVPTPVIDSEPEPQAGSETDAEIDAPEPDEEPAPYPESTTPDPPAFVHPPADAVLIVASNRSFSAGEDGVDRDAKYHTWIWRPAQGALPDKGKIAAEGAPLVQEVEGLIVADGVGQWQVRIEEATVSLPKCADECEGDEPIAGKQSLAKKLYGLQAQPFVDGVASGEPKVLIAAADFKRESGDTCIGSRDAVEHVIQVAAVADGRVFAVERVLDMPFCSETLTGYEQRSQRIFDLLTGEVSIAELENQLSYKERKNARVKAAEALDGFSLLSPAKLAPVTLQLTGLFPTYREFKGGIRLVLQYGAPVPKGEGSGGWGNLFDATNVTIKYPESSSLTAPADALALMAYVHREFASWKVIGWSQVDGSGTPAAPPAE